MDVRGEMLRVIEPSGTEVVPGLCAEDLRVDLTLPKHFERLSLGIVVYASQAD